LEARNSARRSCGTRTNIPASKSSTVMVMSPRFTSGVSGAGSAAAALAATTAATRAAKREWIRILGRAFLKKKPAREGGRAVG